MKKILPFLVLASALPSYASVIYDFDNGLVFSEANPTTQVGTFDLFSDGVRLSGTTALQAFQVVGTTGISIQGGNGDFTGDTTVSFALTLTDSAFSNDGFFSVASTNTVNGAPTANGRGFNIGNGLGGSASDVGFSFNVGGVFTRGDSTFQFDAVNSDLQADGILGIGEIAAADTQTSGEYSNSSFSFDTTRPFDEGFQYDVTVTAFPGTGIAGEAFLFNLNVVPEPSSTALLGLGGLALLLRRKRG